jgi:hypothetical protein
MKAAQTSIHCPPLSPTYETLLGFATRVSPYFLDNKWTSEQRRQFLLLPETPLPLSTDDLLWPSATKDLDRWIGANNGLWENLVDLLGHVAAHVDQLPDETWIIAVTWHHRERFAPSGPFGPYALPTVPARRDPIWPLVGYDISDGSLLSGLSDCGYYPEELRRLAPRWGRFLNSHHLFRTLSPAFAYKRLTDARVREHAPFQVYGLWIVGVVSPADPERVVPVQSVRRPVRRRHIRRWMAQVRERA